MDSLNAELVSVISAAAHNTETVTHEKTQNSIDHVSGSNLCPQKNVRVELILS